MSDDPLAEFRLKGSAPATATSVAAHERDAYRAFAGKDNQRKARLDIRCKDGLAHAVGYNFIIEICYDRRGYTGLVLMLSTMMVKVKGRGLRPIVDALKLGTCEFIQEFNVDEFGPPENDADPFVESIEVVSAAEQQRSKRPER